MTSEKISTKVLWAHEAVANQVAEDYCRNLAKDTTDNTFGTLDGLMDTFRLEIADRVRLWASRVYSAHNVKFRPCLFRDACHYSIKTRLLNDAALRSKLASIRAAQKAAIAAS